MKKEKVIVTEKVCRRCGFNKPIEDYRKRVSGFYLNQCKVCEKEMSTARRVKKNETEAALHVAKVNITTKSGGQVEASKTPIAGGYKATSPLSDLHLYFDETVNRDTARKAFSAYANVSRTGINYKKV